MATANATIRIVAEDKTQKAFKSVDKNLNKTSAALKGLAKRFVLAAGAAGVGGFIKSTVDSADKLDKLSKRLGMSVKALSEYKHVADLSGVSFETMTMGLQRMTRRVAEAAIGTGEAQGALKELNLDAEVLNQMPLDEKFETIAKAIGGMKSESDKVRVAMKLFDSEGVSLIQTMDKTGDKIAKARKEARKLGLAIDADDAANAAAYKDEFVRLKGVFQGLANKTLPTLVPLITSLVQAITNGVTFVSKFGKEIGLVLTVLAELFIISKLTPLFVSMSAAIRGASISAGGATIAFRALWKAIGGPIGVIVTLVTTFVMFKDEIFKAFPALERLYDWFATKIRQAIGWLIDKFKDLWKAFGTLRDWLRDKLGKVIEKFKKGLDDLKKKVDEVGKFIGKYLPNWMSDAEAATTDLEDEIEILYDAFGDLLVEVNHTNKGLTIYVREMKEVVGVTKDMEEKVSDLATELGLVNMSTAQAEKELKKFKDQVIETSDKSKLFHDKLVLLDEAYIDGDVNAETYKKELEKLQAGLSNGETAASDFKDELGEVDTAWGTFTGNIKSEWTTMWSNLFTGKGGIDSVKDFLKAVKDQFLQTLGEIVAEWTWKKIFGNLLGGDATSSVFSGILDKIVGAFTVAGTDSGDGFLTTVGAALKAGAGKIGEVIGSIFGGTSSGMSTALIPDGVGGFQIAGSNAATSFMGGWKTALSGAAKFAVPLAIAAFGFGKSRKFNKALRAKFGEVMSDPTIVSNLADGPLAGGFKVLGTVGEQTFAQIGSASAEMFRHFSETSGGVFKDVGGSLGFLSFGLKEMKDEFGNVVVTAENFSGLLEYMKEMEPFSNHAQHLIDTIPAYERARDSISLIDSELLRAKVQFKNMGDEAKIALKKVDMGSTRVANIMQRDFVTAADWAAMGMENLGAMSSSMFEKLIGFAQDATGQMQRLAATANSTINTTQRAMDLKAAAGFQHGGSFVVGGGGGTDSQRVSFMATPGERVTVETPNQSKASGSDGGNVVRELRALRHDLASVVAKPIVGAVTRGQLAMAGGARH